MNSLGKAERKLGLIPVQLQCCTKCSDCSDERFYRICEGNRSREQLRQIYKSSPDDCNVEIYLQHPGLWVSNQCLQASAH